MVYKFITTMVVVLALAVGSSRQLVLRFAMRFLGLFVILQP